MVSPTPKRGQPVRPKKRNSSSSRIFYLALAVIAVAGIGALTWMSTRPREQAAAVQVDSTLPKVASNGYTMGSATAPIEVIEFGDFECPVCARFASITEPDVRARLIEPGIIRLRYVDFPLAMHRNTWQASRAAACADEQGKFWPMHDLLYQTQDQWNGQATRSPEGTFKKLGAQIGLNEQQFDSCIDSKKTQAKVQAHEQIAVRYQAGGTPTFVIGGRMITQPLSYDEFKQLVDQALARSGAPVRTDSGATKGTTKAPARPR